MFQVMYVNHLTKDWIQHGQPYANLSDAKSERDYLMYALGLTAAIFTPTLV